MNLKNQLPSFPERLKLSYNITAYVNIKNDTADLIGHFQEKPEGGTYRSIADLVSFRSILLQTSASGNQFRSLTPEPATAGEIPRNKMSAE